MDLEITVGELRKKKVFVATPMYGGMCSGMYTKASADLSALAAKYGLDMRFFYIFNESLITRARNYLVDEFLRSPYTHLMFIDSDIHFSPNDVLTLAALCDDDKPIIGGPYPKKTIAWEKVRNAVDAGIADENPKELEKFTGDFVFNPVAGQNEITITEPIEVLEIGTGFVMIKREVFELWRDTYPQYKYKPDHNRSENFDGKRYIHAFFDTIIDNDLWMGEGQSLGTDRYLSEDYMFCQLARKAGSKVWMCPWIELGHAGTYIFNGALKDLARIQYASHGMDNNSRPHKEKRKSKKSS